MTFFNRFEQDLFLCQAQRRSPGGQCTSSLKDRVLNGIPVGAPISHLQSPRSTRGGFKNACLLGVDGDEVGNCAGVSGSQSGYESLIRFIVESGYVTLCGSVAEGR